MASNWHTLAWLAAAFGCGLIDAAAWAILAAAFGMTCMRAEHQDSLVEKHAAVFGRLQTWCLFLTAAFAGNVIACGAVFLAGRALTALVVFSLAGVMQASGTPTSLGTSAGRSLETRFGTCLCSSHSCSGRRVDTLPRTDPTGFGSWPRCNAAGPSTASGGPSPQHHHCLRTSR